jgi:hypothetical protein
MREGLRHRREALGDQNRKLRAAPSMVRQSSILAFRAAPTSASALLVKVRTEMPDATFGRRWRRESLNPLASPEIGRASCGRALGCHS